MPLKNKKSAAAGVITTHCPTYLTSMVIDGVCKDVPPSVTESRRTMSCRSVRMRSASADGGRGRRRNEAWVPGPPKGPWVDWLSHTSFRRLQVKLEAENQEAGKITQPLLDTENGFVKTLVHFLCHRDVVELRKRELLHKRWTECVWTPIQRHVEEYVSDRCYERAETMRSLSLHYIHYCNTKGFVFLENYDPQEYNPFLLHISRPHYLKVFTPALRDPLFLQSRERIQEKKAALRCQTGHVYTRREVEELLQLNLPHLAPPNNPVTSQTHSLLAPHTYKVSTPRQPVVEVETQLWRPNRSNVSPYWITATPDGRCFQTGCWSASGLRPNRLRPAPLLLSFPSSVQRSETL